MRRICWSKEESWVVVPFEGGERRRSLNCANCAQYVEGQYGDCGGCNLFSGPVQPQGHCLSWAAQAEG